MCEELGSVQLNITKDKKEKKNQYSLYFLLDPLTLSAGYFFAFNSSLRRAAFGKSIPQRSTMVNYYS